MTKTVDRITKFLTVISGVIFAIVVLIVVANVIGRKVLNLPIKGATELVQYGIMLAVGLVMARTGFEGRHIWVSLLVNKFGYVGSRIFITFGCLCGTVIFGMLGYLFLTEMPTYFGVAGRVTEAVHIPYYVIYGIMGVGFVIATLEYLYEFILNAGRIFRRPEEEQGGEEAGDK